MEGWMALPEPVRLVVMAIGFVLGAWIIVGLILLPSMSSDIERLRKEHKETAISLALMHAKLDRLKQRFDNIELRQMGERVPIAATGSRATHLNVVR